MATYQQLQEQILTLKPENFASTALDVFAYQYASNPLYAKFVNLLGIKATSIQQIEQIPCLPISFFKSHLIQTAEWLPEGVFTSSGTTGNTTSQHAVRSLKWYQHLSFRAFEQFYGPIRQYAVLALLPSYLERQGSSLVYMADQFIQASPHPQSGFFLHHTDELIERLKECQAQAIPCLLIGVSFALLDLAEQHQLDLSQSIIMETGGMKGRRKEITRTELHAQLGNAFNSPVIHSEYGMTELLSQAYSKGKGLFHCPAFMRVLCREITDPLSYERSGRAGAVNIIDLGNLDTCSFIATDDLGKVYQDGSFEILGRMDNSDLRGCNLLLGAI